MAFEARRAQETDVLTVRVKDENMWVRIFVTPEEASVGGLELGAEMSLEASEQVPSCQQTDFLRSCCSPDKEQSIAGGRTGSQFGSRVESLDGFQDTVRLLVQFDDDVGFTFCHRICTHPILVQIEQKRLGRQSLIRDVIVDGKTPTQ